MGNPKDFTARQIRTSQLIASGGIGGTSVGMIVYSASISSDMRGGFAKDPHLLRDVGEDTYFFVSGSIDSMVHRGSTWSANGDQGTTVFGGDLFVSGNFEWAGASNTSGWTEAATWLHPTTLTKGVSIGADGDSDPVSMVKVRLDANVDTSGTELREDANYQLIIRNDSSTEDRWSGIGFEVDDTASENTTATILAKRKGNNAQGSLEFYVKTSADADEIPVQALSLKHDSTVNITGSMVDIGWDPNDPPTEQSGPSLRLTSHHHSLNPGDTLGVIEFAGHQANAKGAGAKIISDVAGGWGTAGGANRPADLQFWTSPDTNDAASQRMVITKDGEVAIGLDTNSPSAMLHVSGNIPSSNAAIRLDGPFGEKGRFVDLELYGFSDNQSPANVVVKTVGVVSGAAPAGFRKVAFDRGAGGADDRASFSWNMAYKGEGAGRFSHLDHHILYGGDKVGGLFLSALSVTSSSYGLGYNYPAVDPGAQVLILSGTTASGADEVDPRKFTDTNFFVSGSAGSRNSQRRGTSVFGGDVVISGSLYGGSPLEIGSSVNITGSMVDIGWNPNNAGTNVGATLRLSSHDAIINSSTVLGTIEFYGDDITTDNKGIGAKIKAAATDNWSAGQDDYPTELQFWTCEDGGDLDQRMVITDEGYVGIGVESPVNRLETVDGVSIGATYSETNVAPSDGLIVEGGVGIGTPSPSAKLEVAVSHSNATIFIRSHADHSGSLAFRKGTLGTAAALVLDNDEDFVLVNSGTAREILIKGHLDGDGDKNFIRMRSRPLAVFGGSQMLFMSGVGESSPESDDPATSSDANFWVSGSIGSKGSQERGTAVFAGDMLVSGTIYGTLAGGVAAGGWVDDGGIVRLETISDKVGIGTVDPGPDATLAVAGGDVALSGSHLDVAHFIRHMGDLDTYLEFTDNKFSLQAGGIKGIQFDQSESIISLNNESEEVFTLIKTPDRLAFRSGRIGPTLDGSNQSIVLILSGGGDPTAHGSDPQKMTDVGFFVSGSIGSRGTTVRGTSMFGGDVVISGSLYGGSPLSVGSGMVVSGTLITSGSSYMSGSTTISGSMTVTGSLTVSGSDTFTVFGPTLLNAGGASDSDIRMQTANKTHAFFADTSTDQVLILSGGADHDPDFNVATWSDTNFFVSGTIGSKGKPVKGTSVFGGDLQVSGTIYGTIAGGTSAGGWTDDGSVVKLTTISDQVGIGLPGSGDTAPGAGVKLAVRGGDTVLSGTNLDVAESIRHIGDTDTRIEFSDDQITFDAGGLTLFKINSEGVNQNIVLILSGGGPTSPNESNASDLAFYVSGSIGSRGTSVRGTSVFGGDVVVSGSHQISGSLSLGQYGGQKEITSRTTKRISYSDIVSSAQIIDQFVAKPPNLSGFRCVKYTIGGKPAGSNDRFFSDLIVVGDQGSNNGAVATSETRVHTDIDSGGSLEFLNETHVDITATRSAGIITIKIQGDSTYFQGNGNNNAMEISLERLVILD